jgi:gliding motility-associated-like protein
MRFFLCIICFLLILSFKSFATHIVGGEIFYDHIGGNDYRITLKLYRDCFLGAAPYDNPATIFIFNSSGSLVDSVEIPFPGSVVLPSTINNPCFIPPTDVCVEEAIYQAVVTLPPVSGGYDLMYQRCCRNNSILNIINPGDVGSTYMAHIPDASLATSNSSPHYTNFPPIFICSGVPLNFNHAATDADGDSLYYEFCDPFTGLDPSCPILGIQAGTCPALGSPPPYATVPWLSPYSASYPLSSSPALNIDSQTGVITGTPNTIGQWVVGVCVSEYRNGVLLDVNKRDFQFNVVDCPNLPVASIPEQSQFCNGYNVNFTQNSVNAFTYHWDFGDPLSTADTSSLDAPSWTYADSGAYTVTLIINPGSLCVDTQTSVFYIYPLLDPLYVAPVGECIYENSFNFNGGGTYSSGAVFDWDFGASALPSNSNLLNPSNVVYSQPGTYPVIFTVSENGCSKSHTDSIEVYPKPTAFYTVASEVICELSPVQFNDSSVSDSPLTYSWNFGNGTTSTLEDPVVEFASPGLYITTLSVTSEKGCKDTFQLPNPIDVKASPVAGFSLTPQITSIFDSKITAIDQSIFSSTCQIFWGDGSLSNSCDSTHSYSVPGNYSVMQVVVNELDCRDTAYQDVTIQQEFLFWIPNAFTPDENALNDSFKPVIYGVRDYRFSIFDRWGRKLFETSDTTQGWNGFYKKELCKSDTYVYKVSFVDNVQNDFHQFVGRVTLLQ